MKWPLYVLAAINSLIALVIIAGLLADLLVRAEGNGQPGHPSFHVSDYLWLGSAAGLLLAAGGITFRTGWGRVLGILVAMALFVLCTAGIAAVLQGETLGSNRPRLYMTLFNSLLVWQLFTLVVLILAWKRSSQEPTQ